MRGIQAINPTNEHFAELEQIRSFAEAYDADVVDLEHELHQVKRLIARLAWSRRSEMKRLPYRTAAMVTFVSFIGRYGDAFHELHRLGNIAVALPVSTASRERSFSALLCFDGSETRYRMADLEMSLSWPLNMNAPSPSV